VVKCEECAYLKILRYKVSSDTYQCLIQDNITIFNIDRQRYCEFYYPLKRRSNTVDLDPLIENDHKTFEVSQN